MFILRRITARDNVEMNFALGASYTLVTKDKNPENFKQTKDHLKYDDSDDVFAFVSTEGGKILALFSHQQNYIMTGDGKTFTRIYE